MGKGKMTIDNTKENSSMTSENLKNFFKANKPKIVSIGLAIHREWSHESQDCLFQNIDNAKNWRIHQLLKLYEESLIQRARNHLVKEFLASPAEYLFFVDDDICLIDNDAIDRLVAADKDIIGAVCVTKKPPHNPCFKTIDGKFPEDIRKLTKPLYVNWVGCGAMLIKRHVLQKLVDKYKYAFDCPVINGEYLSEDWGFCHHAKMEGFEVWVEPTIRNGHIGKYLFSIDDYYNFNNFNKGAK